MSGISLVVFALLAQAVGSPTGKADKALAQRLLSEGAAFFASGELVPALEKFQEAYLAYPSPKLLFNIGQTCSDMGKYDEALAAYERFLAENPETPEGMKAEAQDSVAALKTRLGMVNVVCTTPEVNVSLDGKAVAFTSPSTILWVMPGRHLVIARHSQASPVVADVDVVAGQVRTVVLKLKLDALDGEGRARSTVAAGPSWLTQAADSQAAPKRGGWLLGRTWTWVAAGGAVALAAGATVAGLSMQSRLDSLNKSCGNASPAHSGCSQSDIDSVLARKNTANALWGLAGAVAIVAGILFHVEGRSVTVAPMAGTATGVLAGSVF